MKTIYPGDESRAFWWVRKNFECKVCGQVSEIEKEDFGKKGTEYVDEIYVECPLCKKFWGTMSDPKVK